MGEIVTERFTGVLTELGGPEIGSTGNEKPRKVIIKQDPSKQYGKTFRTWSNGDLWDRLQPLIGQTVTVEFVVEERQGGPSGTYSQNLLVDVLENGDGGGQGNGSSGVWGSASPAPESSTPSSADWSVPSSSTPSEPMSKDDYWRRKEERDLERQTKIEQRQAETDAAITARQAANDERERLRTLEMEAAWAIHAVLQVEGADHGMSDDEFLGRAMHIALLKRRMASELGK